MIRVHFPEAPPHENEIELVKAVRGGADAYVDTPWNRRYRELFQKAQEHFVSVPLGDAQVVFFPIMYREGRHSQAAAMAARARGVPIVFMRTGDWPDPVNVPYGVVYRHSIFASRRMKGEEAMPAFCEDMLLERSGQVPVRTKQVVPSVGFRGFVSSKLMRLLYRMAGRKRKVEGLELRARLLDAMERSKKLRTCFVRNNQFLGGASGVASSDPDVAARTRAAFVESILDADYTLCLRGAGNFSYRFYEVLSAGRIPLFLNTDGVLPYEDEIDWKKHCAWVEAAEMRQLTDRLLEFHARLSGSEFEQMQRRNRQLWEDYLTPLSFYRRALSKAVADGSRQTS